MSSLSLELSALGPLFQVQETIVTQLTTQKTVLLAPSDARRWAIVINPDLVHQDLLAVATLQTTIDNGGGILVQWTNDPSGGFGRRIEWDVRSKGTLVQQQIYGGTPNASGPAANVNWTVIEVLLVN